METTYTIKEIAESSGFTILQVTTYARSLYPNIGKQGKHKVFTEEQKDYIIWHLEHFSSRKGKQ
jgi:hypothetical protein